MTSTAPAAPKTRAKTRYHIFREISTGGSKTYEPVAANLEANSADNALSTWAAANPNEKSGTYVAVAARRFAPKPIAFTTQTVIKVG